MQRQQYLRYYGLQLQHLKPMYEHNQLIEQYFQRLGRQEVLLLLGLLF
jgi:hypothetical protein